MYEKLNVVVNDLKQRAEVNELDLRAVILEAVRQDLRTLEKTLDK